MILTTVPLLDIDKGDRYRADLGDIEELAKDIQENGLICPIAVQLVEDRYLLVAGERRMTALEMLGWEDVPVRLYERELSEYDLRILELSENLNRKAMTYAEDLSLKSRIHELYIEQHGAMKKETPEKTTGSWGQKDTAKSIGISTSALSRDLKLAKAIKLIPELATCKDKKEAEQRLKQLEKKHQRATHAERISNEVEATGKDIRKRDLMDAYVIRDFFDAAQELPENNYHLVEIDPPYGIDLTKQKKSNDCEDYNEVDATQYKKFLRNTFRACFKLMTEHSWLVCWFAPHPWFDVTLTELQKAGFNVNGMCGIWTKPSGQTHQPTTSLANAYEMFFYARKGKPKLYKEGRTNIYDYKPVPPKMKTHPTERPTDMIKDVLTTFAAPGARVLVPFAGSGATLIAAAQSNMQVVGFDLSQSYKDSYTIRVASEIFI